MNKLCELCHRHYAVLVCEHCQAAICSGCGDCIENDPDDPATWVILCNACGNEDEPYYSRADEMADQANADYYDEVARGGQVA